MAGSFARAGAYASARIARWARTGACASSTGVPYCFGDGIGSACPCGNVGAIGRGCDNSAQSTGARLRAEGQAMISADSVTLRVDGATPLYVVANTQWAKKSFYPQPTARYEKTTYLDLMTLLLDKGADPNAKLAKDLW